MKASTPAIVCPACSGGDNYEMESMGQYRILCCKNCRLSYANPMLAADPQYYIQHIVYQRTDATTIWTHYRSAKKAIKRQILCMVPAHGRVLDIGCGYGAFVKVALESGLDAYGLDFNTKHISAGRYFFGLGQRLMEGTVSELWQHISKETQFDLITMFEVIEHVEEPAKLLREAHSHLRGGGILAVSCPNEARWQPTGRIFVDYPPHHLSRWRPDTMRMFLEHNGFRHIHTQIDSSFRDLFWVAYVNRSARKQLARKLSAPSNKQKTVFSEFQRSATTRSIKMKLDGLLRMTSAPFDIMLKATRIGTMGMLMIARKV